MFRGPRLDPNIRCSSTVQNGQRVGIGGNSRSHASPSRLRIDAKVLLFAETQYSHLGREIAEFLVHNRLKYDIFYIRLCTNFPSAKIVKNNYKIRK
jgi:hypothetical protein